VSVSYSTGWFRAEKRALGPMSEEEARRRHGAREPYCAVVETNGVPSCFIEVNDDFFGVSFLDELLREYLSYDFEELEPGRLFLTTATFRQFQGSDDNVASGETYFFKPDGGMAIEIEDFVNDTFEEKRGGCEMGPNWAEFPAFGAYDPLMNRERLSAT
jgi:hypothetical protein